MWILNHYGFSNMENRFLVKNRKSWFLRNFHNVRTRIWMMSSTVGGCTSHGNFQRAISTCREQLSQTWFLFYGSNLSIKQFQMMFMCNSRYFVAQGKNGTERLASKSCFSISLSGDSRHLVLSSPLCYLFLFCLKQSVWVDILNDFIYNIINKKPHWLFYTIQTKNFNTSLYFP